MTALVLGVVSAVLLGVSDFCAARAARRAPSLTVTRTAAIASTVLAPLLFLVRDVDIARADVVLALGSGLFMSTGLAFLYHGYSVARVGVVAPLSSVLLAAVPVVWDIVGGACPSVLSATGMAIGVIALGLTSYTPNSAQSLMLVVPEAELRAASTDHDRVAVAVHDHRTTSGLLGPVLGLASGVAFGIAYVFMSRVSDEAGLSSVAFQRVAGLSLLLSLALVRTEPVVAAPGEARWYAIGTGAAGVVAIGALQWAFQAGSEGGGSMTGPVSVASSQFATVAVLLAVAFNRERMRWWQAIGVAATAVAVSLIALG